MHIFIDESGNFTPPGFKRSAISCVVALVIPEEIVSVIEKEVPIQFASLMVNGELKGRNLSDKDITSIIEFLLNYDIFMVAYCIDMIHELPAQVTTHKNGQADKYSEVLKQPLSEGLRADIIGLVSELRSLSNQLYIQSSLLTSLASKVIKYSTLYYCQRIPEALGSFKWRIDAKGKSITRYEELWLNTVLNALQTISLTDPLPIFENGDYTHFQKFRQNFPEIPAYLKCAIPDHTGPFSCTDIKAIVKGDIQFSDSKKEIGIQLADILANSLKRTLNKTIPFGTTARIGELMIQGENKQNAVDMVTLETGVPGTVTRSKIPYAGILKSMSVNNKQMLV